MADIGQELQFAPRYVRVRETLRKQIEGGTYHPRDRIPSETEIMEQFDVSRITVINAIKDLVREGLLIRVVPKGTFVTERKPDPRKMLVALCMQTGGHLYSEISQPLIGNLQSRGYYPVVFDPTLLDATMLHEKLEALLGGDFEWVVIYGFAAFPFNLLREKTRDFRRLIFLSYCETPVSFPGARKVLTDFHAGGYAAVKHILGLGHRRILLHAHPPEPEPYHVIHSLLRGCCQAYDEAHLDFNRLFSTTEWTLDLKRDEEMIADVLARPDQPRAVFCLGDHHAREVFAAARRLNLRIPDDVAVVGYFNTPWCDHLDVPLTSVSIEEGRLADAVADIIAAKQGLRGSNVIVKPKLIVRASCGARINSRRNRVS
ncbi:MAG: substrate-binding domain-containing protein [Verrucomicrobia bacterium]|nr:substrate-binding domain-containing protein [Verrucomicrobiota bacterium]